MTEKGSLQSSKTSGSPRLNQRRAQILEKAAHLFCVKGYDSTSMSDIADEVGITKAGLYYFVESKEHLLYLITDYGLDLLDETVIQPLEVVAEPRQHLQQLIRLHVHMVLNRPREVTIILHERTALTGVYREKILQRKKDYINYVRHLLKQLQASGDARADVDPTAATFFLLGALNWVYQWYKVDGPLSEEQLATELISLFTKGFLTRG
ncbi:MAG TPA: TetR/AcrR family transcriptional regulator [Vicinamibacteria bacterium]|nr:TetR/AcrR family transcriptional regulator [Vicinamibacteria bacterium]